ncbi:hypothetical protein K439DRAFT_1634733 [Ramaria rubella]|nr:hypothetical protein K439DRAFT_1634733 [Ramaria rubella]
MSFTFTSSPSPSFSHSRPIKSSRHPLTIPSPTQIQFSVPNGPNWVYASGGSRPVRFDFSKALDEKLASEDETCGSSQEYYARKSASSASNNASGFVPPVLPEYKTDARFLYPTQRPNYAFNFDRATRDDIDNMNTALPFNAGPAPPRKQKTRKDIEKVARTTQNSFEFGRTTSSFSPPAPQDVPKASHHSHSMTLMTRSQNHDSHTRRISSKTRVTRK